MDMTTEARAEQNRRSQRTLRAKRRKEGFKQITLWLRPEVVKAVAAYAKKQMARFTS
jgi:hypothetical protein